MASITSHASLLISEDTLPPLVGVPERCWSSCTYVVFCSFIYSPSLDVSFRRLVYMSTTSMCLLPIISRSSANTRICGIPVASLRDVWIYFRVLKPIFRSFRTIRLVQKLTISPSEISVGRIICLPLRCLSASKTCILS